VLTRLFIQNYAIIDQLEIDFSQGFSAITGETGAGKSIIIGALGLILGQRADSSVLVNKEKKMVVEGIFQPSDKKTILAFLHRHELEEGEELLLRREIAVNGKSRAFINDSPVTLTQLQELSSFLVDLHQQFDTLELGESTFQRDVLDALAGQQALVESYQEHYQLLLKERAALAALVEQKRKFEAAADYNRFQFEELEQASFKLGELEALDEELKTLSHAEGIRSMLQKATNLLSLGEQPVVSQVKTILSDIGQFLNFHKEFPALEERLRATYVELKDIGDELEKLEASVSMDPQRMEEVSERISLGYRLCKKHQVTTTDELLAIQQHLSEQLHAVLDLDQSIENATKQVQSYTKKASEMAAALSVARKKQAPLLEKKVNELLKRVGMPSAQLKVTITEMPLGKEGVDHIEFLFDANRSGQFQPLRKVASGGELSRLMLCIKSLVAASINLPTMIFDEIDTGIAGEAARQVGLLLQELAAKRQVICITHQPQIAGKAAAQYFVFKEAGSDAKARAKTGVRQLSTQERVSIIAQMIGGENPSEAALANARELLS
jgi:DNA repair protein RecN (Recombination protein N)